jgi:hypothetical protein
MSALPNPPCYLGLGKNCPLPILVNVIGNQPLFVKMLQLTEPRFLGRNRVNGAWCGLRRGTGGGLGRRYLRWRRGYGRTRSGVMGFARPQAIIMFGGAFDGATFRKSREYLRALIEMCIAGRRT